MLTHEQQRPIRYLNQPSILSSPPSSSHLASPHLLSPPFSSLPPLSSFLLASSPHLLPPFPSLLPSRFHWVKGPDRMSNATVEWHIPPSARPGSYRIRHFGHHKQFKGFLPVITAYQGTSEVFTVSQTYYY